MNCFFFNKENQKTSINSSNEVINQNSADINKIDEIPHANMSPANSDQNSLVTENELINNTNNVINKASHHHLGHKSAYEKTSQQSSTDLESVANSASNLLGKNWERTKIWIFFYWLMNHNTSDFNFSINDCKEKNIFHYIWYSV